MRSAMKAANKAKRFTRVGFNAISLHSENRHQISLDSLSCTDFAYQKPK